MASNSSGYLVDDFAERGRHDERWHGDALSPRGMAAFDAATAGSAWFAIMKSAKDRNTCCAERRIRPGSGRQHDDRRGRTTLRGEVSAAGRACSGTASAKYRAGGATPWASWLTCEETTIGVGTAEFTKNHGDHHWKSPADGTARSDRVQGDGQVFARGSRSRAPRPAGCTNHRDADRDAPGSMRFVRLTRGAQGNERWGSGDARRESGHARIRHAHGTRPGSGSTFTGTSSISAEFRDLAGGQTSVFNQGFTKGAARFARLEGAWPGHGSIYFLSTSGGDVSQGQIFEYAPVEERVRLLFESPSADILNAPDNMREPARRAGAL